MQEQEENIQFDNMPNFVEMFSPKVSDWDDEKEYNSLYDELLEKCRPDKFIGDTSDNKKFLLANQLYAELKSKQGHSDNELIDFRDRAMSLLGIHISTKKLYSWLEEYLNPQVYTTMEPYDAERVALAGEYYMRMRECKDDIHALEKLRDDAAIFIDRKLTEDKIEYEKRQEEEKIAKQKEQEEKNNQFTAITFLVLFLVAVVIIIIATSQN